MNKDLILYGGLAVGGFILANKLIKTINPTGESLASNIGKTIVVSTIDAAKDTTTGAISGAWNYQIAPEFNVPFSPIKQPALTLGDLIFPISYLFKQNIANMNYWNSVN